MRRCHMGNLENTVTESTLATILDVWDALTSPQAKDLYAGAAVIVMLAILAEIILAIF
jgi:hypothetical protein